MSACSRIRTRVSRAIATVAGVALYVVAQLHMVEADAGEAEAALNALLDDEASKLRILDYLRRWLGDKPEEMPPVSST